MIIVVFVSYDEKTIGSGLTIFNGAYPVHYECHESTVWVELQHVLLEPWIAKRGKNRSCRCMLQWLRMGVCLNAWDAYHMEREQTVSVDGMKRIMPCGISIANR